MGGPGPQIFFLVFWVFSCPGLVFRARRPENRTQHEKLHPGMGSKVFFFFFCFFLFFQFFALNDLRSPIPGPGDLKIVFPVQNCVRGWC